MSDINATIDRVYRDVWSTVKHADRLTEFGKRMYAAGMAEIEAKGWVTLSRVNGQLVAVTRQDDDHRILSIIWQKGDDAAAPPLPAP